MTFILRQISYTAEGREIARGREFAQDRLTIGRGTGCDIVLPDLALSLNHAAIERRPDGSVHVTSHSGMPFVAEGASVTWFDANPAAGANLRFGSHALLIGREGSAITLRVERVEALSDSSEAKDEQAVFSLASTGIRKRIPAWAFASLILLAFLLWPIWTWATYQDVKERPVSFHADQSWSSGHLSLEHAKLENNCQSCHVNAFEPVRDAACVVCHAKVHDHADKTRLIDAKGERGLFGKFLRTTAEMANKQEGRCVDCHVEHEGAGKMPPTAQRFCTSCHDGMTGRLADTKIQDAVDFGTGHPEFRPAIVTAPGERPMIRRVSLAARPHEESGLKFPHDLHLSGSGGVARMALTLSDRYGFGKQGMACKDCHISTPDGVRFQPIDMEKNCGMCHSLGFDKESGVVRTLRHGDPRQVVAEIRSLYRSGGPVNPAPAGVLDGRYIPGVGALLHARSHMTGRMNADQAVRAVFSKGGACYDCHQVVAPAGLASPDFQVRPVVLSQRYMFKGWFDHKAHDTEKCTTCHLAPQSKNASDVLLPGIKTCRTCHDGESASGKKVASTCAMCHDYHMDDAAPFGVRPAKKQTALRN